MPENYSDLIKQIEASLKEAFPLELIPRKMIGQATGGLLNSRTLANEDCLKTGIEDPVMVGKQVCYRNERVVEYLEKKITPRNIEEAV